MENNLPLKISNEELPVPKKQMILPQATYGIAVTFFPDWIPIDKLEETGKKHNLKVYKIEGSPLTAVQDEKITIQYDFEKTKSLKLRYGDFLAEVHDIVSDNDLLFDEYMKEQQIFQFAHNLIKEVSKDSGLSKNDINELKNTFLNILEGIVYEEEAILLAKALTSTDEEEAKNNFEAFLKIFVKKTQRQLFAITIRAFQTQFFFNLIDERIGKDYLNDDTTEIAVDNRKLELKKIMLPDPYGSGTYHKLDKIAIDLPLSHFYVINTSGKKLGQLVNIFSLFLVDNVFIEQACWFLEQIETILRRFSGWQKDRVKLMLIEMKDKATVEQLKTFKEKFIKINEFLLSPAGQVLRLANDTKMDVIKNTLKAKSTYKNFWLGLPPQWYMEMLPRVQLDRLSILINFTQENYDSLVEFIGEFCQDIDDLIDYKENNGSEKRWKNIGNLAELIGRFFKGYNGE